MRYLGAGQQAVLAMFMLFSLIGAVCFSAWWAGSSDHGKKAPVAQRWTFISFAVALVSTTIFLSGCVETINPVRYQVQEVLVTKPCLVGRNPPPEAQTRIAVTCDGKDCTLKCSDTRPEECAKHMAADIIELQREARESRRLIQECSK